MERPSTSDTKRVLKPLTPGNLRNKHFYLTGHYDFFPADCFGSSRQRGGTKGCEIEIVLDGLDDVIRTDIGSEAKTGKPRRFFRERKLVRRFYDQHQVTAGEKLALERLDQRRYRVSVERTNGNGNGWAIPSRQD